MAVNTIYDPVKQAGNGVTVAFSAAFKILLSSDVVAYKGNAASPTVWTKGVLNTDYTVAWDPIAETVTVTWTVAPVSGGYSLIARSSDETQGTVYPRENNLPAKTTENCVDKLTLLTQEIFEYLTRVPVFAITDVDPPVVTVKNPPVGAKGLLWIDNGDGTFTIGSSDDDLNGIVAAAEASEDAAADSANAALASQVAALASQVAAAASAVAAAASAATLSNLTLSGLRAARPAAPATLAVYYSTDVDVIEMWHPAASRWVTIG